MPASLLLLASLMTAAAVMDLRTRRVPNAMPLSIAACGLLAATLGVGLVTPATAGLGLLAGLALLMPLWLGGVLGAADVKLLAAAGAWIGAGGVLWAAGAAAVASIIFAVAYTLWRGDFAPWVQASLQTFVRLRHANVLGVPRVGELRPGTLQGPPLPFAVPLLVGVLVAAVMVQL